MTDLDNKQDQTNISLNMQVQHGIYKLDSQLYNWLDYYKYPLTFNIYTQPYAYRDLHVIYHAWTFV